MAWDPERVLAEIGRGVERVHDELRARMGPREASEPAVDPAEVHRALVASAGVHEGFDAVRVRALGRRVNEAREDREPLVVSLVRVRGSSAFALPDRYVYMTTELLSFLPRDGSVAFVLAHEMAHHDLGHLDVRARVGALVGRLGVEDPAKVANHSVLGWIRPEWERAADAEALRTCLRCGYLVADAVAALEACERWAKAHGASGARLHGPDERAARWWHERATGYPSPRRRIGYLKALGDALRDGC